MSPLCFASVIVLLVGAAAVPHSSLQAQTEMKLEDDSQDTVRFDHDGQVDSTFFFIFNVV